MSAFDCFAISKQSTYRGTNEDYVATDPDLGVFAVADGMGGRPGGALASKMAVEAFIEALRLLDSTQRLVETNLRMAVDEANRKIRQIAEENKEMAGLGTTMTAAIIAGGKGKFVHIGDSRLYLFRCPELVQLTKDHTLVSELIARNLLNKEQARQYPLRHVLSMALGTKEKVEPDVRDFVIGTDECAANGYGTAYCECSNVSAVCYTLS